MCLREISPGERDMVTSGGEREERQAWTHDSKFLYMVSKSNPPIHRSLCTFTSL